VLGILLEEQNHPADAEQHSTDAHDQPLRRCATTWRGGTQQGSTKRCAGQLSQTNSCEAAKRMTRLDGST
jgi:hypothetical protein